MRRSTRLAQAADNNARWCDAVCRTHAAAGVFHEHLWLTSRPTPRFYPNVVTLSAAPGVAVQRAAVRDLAASGLLPTFAIKDSFATLDLAPDAFQLLFEARWIWRAASRPRPGAAGADLRCATVRGAAELAAWEAAWNGPIDAELAAPPPRVFLPALLDDADIRFIAAYRGEDVVGGAIANRSGEVVGVSNVFGPADDLAGCWAVCLAAVGAAFPGLPLVGYERGDDLRIARALGFEALGPLRVWAFARPS